MAQPWDLLDKPCLTLRLDDQPKADVSEDQEVEVSDGDTRAVDGASLSSSLAQCVEVSGSVWAPGSGGGYPRCPPAAPDVGSVQGSESSEGCHEASFLLLFCFLRLK